MNAKDVHFYSSQYVRAIKLDPRSFFRYAVTWKREKVIVDGVHRLLGVSRDQIQSYFNEIKNDIHFEERIQAALEENYVGQIICDGARTLYVLCRLLRPEVMIETGVASGVSSSYILYAMGKNQYGHLHSIDLPNHDPKAMLPGQLKTGFVVPEELKCRWDLILDSSQNALPPLLKGIKQIDIFFHDSEHSYENMIFEYRETWPVIKKNGLLISHDVAWNTAFQNFSAKVQKKPILLWGLGALRK